MERLQANCSCIGFFWAAAELAARARMRRDAGDVFAWLPLFWYAAVVVVVSLADGTFRRSPTLFAEGGYNINRMHYREYSVRRSKRIVQFVHPLRRPHEHAQVRPWDL